MFKSGRKKKRSDRSSTEEEPRNPKRTNMAASEQEDSAEEDNEEPSLSEIRKMLVDLQSTSPPFSNTTTNYPVRWPN